MRPSALERMRLDAEVGESARTLAEAAEAFRLCLELERDCRVAEEASRRSALHDEGLPTTGLTVAVLERWRREREAAHALIASRLAGLKAATERAEVALRRAEDDHRKAVLALERHARVEERREGRGSSR